MKANIKRLWVLACCVITLFFSTFIIASEQDISPETKKHLMRYFKKSLPSLKVDSIKSTQVKGLYEVLAGPVVMYVTEDGKYAISGDVLDLTDGETNITELARQKALEDSFNKLGEKNMIVFSPLKPKYTVTVFTDIDCVYCRKFHADIKKINELGIKVRYIGFPRSGKESSSYEKAISVWCASDRKAAITQAKEGHTVPLKKCATSNLDKQFHLGVMAGVSGTPTLVIEGKVIPGYLSPERLLELAETIHNQNNPKKKLGRKAA